MQLELSLVKKPIRELRKSLRELPRNPPARAVHNLRTRSRRLDAIGNALLPRNNEKARELRRIIKPIRRAAGDVRDIDVLKAKVRSLLHRNSDRSFERLIGHLQAMRQKSAHELMRKLARKQKTILRRLKQFADAVENRLSGMPPEDQKAHDLFDELCRWPRLNAKSLHAFRIRIKELRYLLQMMAGANAEFIKALENAKVRIGTWHDWEELHRFATETLDPEKDRNAIAAIAEIESEKLKLAMSAAQTLRNRFLRTHSGLEIAEP